MVLPYREIKHAVVLPLHEYPITYNSSLVSLMTPDNPPSRIHSMVHLDKKKKD